MKHVYLFLLIFIFSSCSKDFLKPYDDRIVGTWRIADINRVGFGGGGEELPFSTGTFVFNNDGSLLYTDNAGNTSDGYWNIEKRNVNSNVIRTLQITAIDFNTQQVKSEFYDDISFRSTNHFVAKINDPLRTFVTHFRR